MASPPFLTSKKRKNTVETKPIRSPFERKDRKKAQRNAQDDDSDDIMIVDDTIDDDAPAATSSRTITPKKKNDFAPKRQMPPWSGGGKSGFDFTHDARIAVAVSKIGTAATSAAPGLKNNDRIPNSPFLPTERISGRPVGGDWAGTEKKIVERHEKREKRCERDRFRPRGLASINDFKSAAGGSANKPFAQVVDKTSDDSENNISPAQMPKRFLGTKPLGRGFNPPQMIQQAIKPPVVNVERSGLADEPSLKHFDNNIIALIESEIMSITKETGWTDVAGLEGAKKALREIVVLPFMRPNFFKGIRAPPKGVLLFGPPGTGKTMIGRCVASQCKATFFNISASSLTSKWVGEGEKLVRALFAVARLKLPAVIFIDEIDSLLCSRSESEHESSRRLKTEFLVQLDGVATNSEEKLLVLGATNRPQELDEAARRRFAKRLYIALPDLDARVSIVQKLLEGQKHDLTIENMDEIGRITDGYSGADMRQLCAEASMGPIRDIDNSSSYNIETISEEEIRDISIDDFRQAKRVVRPTVVKADLENYRKWDRQFGCLLQPPDGSVDENDAASVE